MPETDFHANRPAPGRKSRFFRRLAIILVCFAIFGYFTRDFWITTLRAYAIGRVYIASQEYGRFLPPVDEVEILALGDSEVPEGTPDSFAPDIGPRVGTVNRHTIRGTEAAQLATLWRSIDFDKHFGGMCHSPYYALRFRNRGKPVLETSVCWKCSTYLLPAGPFGSVLYGFDSKSEKGQKLLETLTRYAPHPEKKE